jgi:hypothetical protein
MSTIVPIAKCAVPHRCLSIVDAAKKAVLYHPVEQCERKIVRAKDLHKHRQGTLLWCSKVGKDLVWQEQRTHPKDRQEHCAHDQKNPCRHADLRSRRMLMSK